MIATAISISLIASLGVFIVSSKHVTAFAFTVSSFQISSLRTTTLNNNQFSSELIHILGHNSQYDNKISRRLCTLKSKSKSNQADDNDYSIIEQNMIQRIFDKVVKASIAVTIIVVLQFSLAYTSIQSETDVTQPTNPGILSSISLLPRIIQPAYGDSYYSMSDEQKVIAEAWRLIDNSFIDRTFNGVDWFGIRQTYTKKKYKSSDDVQKALTEITGMLGDKYTRYLSPAKYQSIVNSATGTLAGTGIEISQSKTTGQLYASDVQPNSPALQAGIVPGDVFVEVDGTTFLDDPTATPDDVAVKLRGPKGSRVSVVMIRPNDSMKKIDVILERQPITIVAVRSYMSTASIPDVGKVGVIRIKNFSGTTAQIVTEKYNELMKQGAKALVIDVRNNPGGLLPGGVSTASLFLNENKPIVYVVNKAGVVDAQSTLGPGIDTTIPIVLLVDGNTASAAEVFTAALQENNRVQVVGETTFGKGIVQTIRELQSGTYGGLAITVAKYETPNHNNINKLGIPVNTQVPIDCPIDDAVLCLTKSTTSLSKLFIAPNE